MKFQKYVVLLILLVLSAATFSQEDIKIRETVEVVQVEVPVRVFYRGNPIATLNKEDFKLFEGKKRQIIDGFYVKRKKIKIQDVGLDTETTAPSFTPRYFVLVFRILDFNWQLEHGINYLFDSILHKDDQVMAFINDKTIYLDKTYWQVNKKEILKEVLKQESIRARQRLITYFLKIKKELEYTRLKMIEDDPYGQNTRIVIEFLNKYLTTWREYKRKYLIPDIDRYYNFSKHLENIKKEKWVINFYQFEMFPKMKVTGQLHQRIEQMINELMVARSEDTVYSQIISKSLEEIDRELNVASDFPVEEITKLMYKVDTTYHSVIIGIQREALSQDLEYKRISTDIENSLREITKKTGGELVATGNLGSALHTIGNKEDIYYVLTYSPENPLKKEKIRIVVNNKKYKLIYDNNIRADYISEYIKRKNASNPTIHLQNLHFNNKKLFMLVNDFRKIKKKRRFIGKINIHIRLKDSSNKIIFDQNREITAKKNTLTISINFKWLKKGKYTFLVEVVDLLTRKTCLDYLDIDIP